MALLQDLNRIKGKFYEKDKDSDRGKDKDRDNMEVQVQVQEGSMLTETDLNNEKTPTNSNMQLNIETLENNENNYIQNKNNEDNENNSKDPKPLIDTHKVGIKNYHEEIKKDKTINSIENVYDDIKTMYEEFTEIIQYIASLIKTLKPNIDIAVKIFKNEWLALL